ncbi:MAG: amidohydrolase family protein [Pseudonocardia sp.]|nr:amidohydrolase family protein [Pseudonocardia sp.]
MIVRGADLDGTRTDLRLDDGVVTEIAPALPRRPAEPVVEAAGGAVLPGLVDHHLHLFALAAALRSTPCGLPLDAAGLARALGDAPADETGWVRGTGYVETVAGDLDAAALDALHSRRPVRIQHRSGALWTVNGLAAARLGLAAADHPGIERRPDGTPTGRLWRADDWLRAHLPPAGPPDLAEVGRRLAAVGITAVTDATPDLDTVALDALTGAVRGGRLPQRVHLLGAPLGSTPAAPLTAGPYKIVLADSGLPSLDDLADRIRAVHAAGRAVAVHCVTREALVLLLVALDEAGSRPGDRIEHAALVPPELVPDLAARGLRVVTQPGFLADRGQDYLRDLPVADHADLYRCRSLLAAGVPLALSSDAPYGPLDPWAVLGAAVTRHTPDGTVAGAGETLPPRAALDAYLAALGCPGGPARRVEPGAPADLVLLDRPLAAALRALDEVRVDVTIIAGVAVHGAG